jgi:putative oxidoreductase
MNSLKHYADPVYCIMRLIVGLMYACHGAQKILSWFPDPKHPGGDLDFMGALSGWVELVGGLLVAVGLLTRVAAFISSGEMAAAFFMVHSPHALVPLVSWVPLVNGGERAVLYCWVFLFIFLYGPGQFSLDAIFCKSREAAAAPAT